VFRKQIDNLKTNHRGTFVLTDNKFLALGRMSVDRGRGARGVEEALGKAQPVCCFDSLSFPWLWWWSLLLCLLQLESLAMALALLSFPVRGKVSSERARRSQHTQTRPPFSLPL
jgi:hypothetical protein